MGLLSIMSLIVQKRIDRGTTIPVMKTPTPMGMHQGSIVELPDIDIALAQADSSIIKAPAGTQVITAVGSYKLFGIDVYHAYLNDGKSYIQLVSKGGPTGLVQEARLWSNHQEIEPQSVEDWEFWIGNYQKDLNGQFRRDINSQPIRNEFGLIGWPQFQIDGPPQLLYNRTWSPNSPEGMDPVEYNETITDGDGNSFRLKHEACEYYRYLTEANDAVVESLLASMVQQDDGTGFIDIMIGIPLDHTNLKVLSA